MNWYNFLIFFIEYMYDTDTCIIVYLQIQLFIEFKKRIFFIYPLITNKYKKKEGDEIRTFFWLFYNGNISGFFNDMKYLNLISLILLLLIIINGSLRMTHNLWFSRNYTSWSHRSLSEKSKQLIFLLRSNENLKCAFILEWNHILHVDV